MSKNEILEEIKRYNKIMLKLRLEELANEQERNFDRRNAVAEQISTSREVESEETKKILKKYLQDKGVLAIGSEMADEWSITTMIFACNSTD